MEKHVLLIQGWTKMGRFSKNAPKRLPRRAEAEQQPGRDLPPSAGAIPHGLFR